jgi:TRAP transporter TAXI family solute receptor
MVILTGVLVSEVAAKKVTIRVDGGSAGGGKNLRLVAIGEAIRKANPGWDVNVVTGPAAFASLGMMARGNMELSTLKLNIMLDVKKGRMYPGKPLPGGPLNLSWLAVSNYSMGGLNVLKKTPINSFPELKEKKYPIRIAINRIGSDPYISALAVLKAYGMTIDDIKSWGGKVYFQSVSPMVKMVADGMVDGGLVIGTMPNSALIRIARTHPLKVILPTEKQAIESLIEQGFQTQVIPRGAFPYYPDAEGKTSVSVVNLIVVRTDMDEDVAYNITRALWEKRDFLKSIHPVFKRNLTPEVIRTAAKLNGDILHPGAKTYWREKGILE